MTSRSQYGAGSEPLSQGAREGRGQGPAAALASPAGSRSSRRAARRGGPWRSAPRRRGAARGPGPRRELPDDPADPRREAGQRGGRGPEDRRDPRGPGEPGTAAPRAHRDHPWAKPVAGREGAAAQPAARRQEGQDGPTTTAAPSAHRRPSVGRKPGGGSRLPPGCAAGRRWIEDQGEGGPIASPRERARPSIPAPGAWTPSVAVTPSSRQPRPAREQQRERTPAGRAR